MIRLGLTGSVVLACGFLLATTSRGSPAARVGTLDRRGYASVESISCAAAGECVAGGFYVNRDHERQAFVVNETNGSWGNAITVPGMTKLNRGRGKQRAFVVSETHGSWQNAIHVSTFLAR